MRLREICDSQSDMIHTAVGPAGGGRLFDQLQHAGPVLQERDRRSLVFIPEDLHKVQHILIKADRPLQSAHIDADMRQIQVHWFFLSFHINVAIASAQSLPCSSVSSASANTTARPALRICARTETAPSRTGRR